MGASFKSLKARWTQEGGGSCVEACARCPVWKLGPSSTERSLAGRSLTHFLNSSSSIFRQKVSRTLLRSCSWITPVLFTSMSLRALIMVLMFLKICV